MAHVTKRTTRSGEARYDVEWRLVDGKVRTKTFSRRKDAEAFRARMETHKADGDAIDPRRGRVTFGAYAETWIANRLVNGRPLTPMTKQGYSGLLKRNILPTFGALPLRAITADRVGVWHAKLLERNPDQAAKSYRLLRAILNTAVSERRLPRNPCTIKGAGTEHAPERPMLDTVTVLDLADAITPRLRALVILGAFVTLRPGELLGLRRCDVDLLKRQLHVRQQVHEIAGSGRIVIPHAKTAAGMRTLTIHEHAIPALTEHLASYAEPGAEGLLFTGPSGGALYRSRLSREWAKACRAVGIEGVRIHDLRHHAATITAYKTGVTTRELMARLGHRSDRAALRYQHATEERDREIASFIDEVIEAAEARRRERAESANVVVLDDHRQSPAG